jgi:hypothetical protein
LAELDHQRSKLVRSPSACAIACLARSLEFREVDVVHGGECDVEMSCGMVAIDIR